MKRLLVLTLLAAIVAGTALASGGTEARAQRVVAYTAHEDTIIAEMTARFEQETGMEIEFIKMGSGDVIRRVVAESSNPQADIIWSIGGEALEANSGVLEPYIPKEWDRIADVYKVGTNWLPYTGIMNVFIVNTNMTQPGLRPQSWTDLADPRLKGYVSTARADQSGSAYMQLANVLSVYGNRGWEVYESIMKNFVLSTSSGAISRLVNDGEMVVGVTLEDNAHRFVQGGGPVTIVYPSDGTIAAPDGIALIKGAPNPDAGKRFIDWALSKSTQDFLVEKMGRRSVRIDGQTPPGLPPLSEINTIQYDFGWAAANRDAYIQRFTQLMMQLGL